MSTRTEQCAERASSHAGVTQRPCVEEEERLAVVATGFAFALRARERRRARCRARGPRFLLLLLVQQASTSRRIDQRDCVAIVSRPYWSRSMRFARPRPNSQRLNMQQHHHQHEQCAMTLDCAKGNSDGVRATRRHQGLVDGRVAAAATTACGADGASSAWRLADSD